MVKKYKPGLPKKFFLVAGEPSGDQLGANLMEGLSRIFPGVEYFGVGGPAMTGKGLVSKFPYEELSVMGITEVLANLPGLLRRKNQLVNDILGNHYDAVVTIDSPDFTLRIAKGIKKGGYKKPVIHYVAPTVWAWRKGRVKSIRKCVDHILTLFPFENAVLEKSGISCSFVGHPIASIDPPDSQEIARVANHLGLVSGNPILLILPGSRRSEITKMGPVFGKVGHMFKKAFPEYQLVVVPSPGFSGLLKDTNTFGWPNGTIFFETNELNTKQLERMKLSLFSLSDLAMASSGTVSLELAATSTPMVIGYDLNWISRQIIGSMLLVDTVTLVNLITSTRVIPEFLGKNMTPENMFSALKKIATDSTLQKTQVDIFEEAMISLGKNNSNVLNLSGEAVSEFIRNYH